MTNLALYVNDLSELIDKRKQVDAIYTDLSKAFNLVDHSMLIKKLRGYGFEVSFLKWFNTYLVDRKLKVVVGGYEVTEFTAGTGVPQGSRLGPVLFNIFINDIGNCFLNSDFLLYADDLKLYRKIESEKDAELLQEDLDRLTVWCHLNKMTLNINKCFVVSFTRKSPVNNTDFVITSMA